MAAGLSIYTNNANNANNANPHAKRIFHNARQCIEMPTTPFYVVIPPPTPEAQKSSNKQERVSVKGLRIEEGKKEKGKPQYSSIQVVSVPI